MSVVPFGLVTSYMLPYNQIFILILRSYDFYTAGKSIHEIPRNLLICAQLCDHINSLDEEVGKKTFRERV